MPKILRASRSDLGTEFTVELARAKTATRPAKVPREVTYTDGIPDEKPFTYHPTETVIVETQPAIVRDYFIGDGDDDDRLDALERRVRADMVLLGLTNGSNVPGLRNADLDAVTVAARARRAARDAAAAEAARVAAGPVVEEVVLNG